MTYKVAPAKTLRQWLRQEMKQDQESLTGQAPLEDLLNAADAEGLRFVTFAKFEKQEVVIFRRES